MTSPNASKPGLWTAILFAFLMIAPICQAEISTDSRESIRIAHPKQAGMGQPFLVRLTASNPFDRI